MGLFVKQLSAVEEEAAEIEQQLIQIQDKNDFFIITIRTLLYFIKEFSLDLTEIGSDKFKKSIEYLSKYFTSEETTKKLQKAFEDSKHLIIDFINKEKGYLQDRNGEFLNVIELLTKAIHTINDENKDFNSRVDESSRKLEEITYLNDTRQIKEELKQEVEQIKRCVRDKQNRDARRLQALTHEVENLQVDVQHAQHASMTDGLTGGFNRFAFDTHLAKLIDRNMITPVPFSLLMLDIDNFKQINDTHGHPAGDRVIMAVAQHCKELIRRDDFLARYGGEEFALVLPATSMRHGLKKGRAICKSIAETRYTVTTKEMQTSVSFTVSIGVSTFQPGDTVDSIVSRADQALYEAKRLGKNCALSEKRVV